MIVVMDEELIWKKYSLNCYLNEKKKNTNFHIIFQLS